jgi:hypothetical protein
MCGIASSPKGLFVYPHGLYNLDYFGGLYNLDYII